MSSSTPSSLPNAPLSVPSPQDDYDLLLAVAAELHKNGEETNGGITAIEQLNQKMGLETLLQPSWGELFLQVKGEQVRVVAAVPENINMSRVVATLHIVEAFCAGQIDKAGMKAALADAGCLPVSNLWLFVFACTIGAGALSIINGATHVEPIGLIMICAGLSGLLRRGLANVLNANTFLQMFAATLLAGFVGAIGFSWHISSAMRLVALGPLFVLVPGPTILNGMIDIAALRFPLGFARVAYGLFTVLVMCTGVIIGLTFGGTTLPALVPNQKVPFWIDVICAGIAAGSYGVFFSMPLRLIWYPVLTGMLAHAIRWEAIYGFGLSNFTGAGLACLMVGIVLVPIARRRHLPFAGVGFASVVSMVPGVFLFRMSGGLVEILHKAQNTSTALIGVVISDSTTALLTVIMMALGLVLPISAYAHFNREKSSKVA